MERWSGKIAIVTGASAGIGESITKALVEYGVNVIAIARREEKLKKLSKSLENSKGSVYPMKCDLRKEEDILNVFKYAEKKFGGVDILINNAGILVFEQITDGKTENYRALLELNVLAPTITIREMVKSVRKRHSEGHIININSYLGRYATAAPCPMSIYQATKYALRAITENVRKEFKVNNDNIKITGIHPGLVKTEIIDAAGGPSNLFDIAPYIKSENVTDAVLFALKAPDNVELNEIMVLSLHA